MHNTNAYGMATANGSITRRAFLGTAGTAAALGAVGVANVRDATHALASEDAGMAGTQAASANTAASFEVEPDPIDESLITETKGYDVVVVGGSAAGLAATAAAAEEGASVICIEKLSSAMGAGTYYGFINTKVQLAAGMEQVDEDQYIKDLELANLGAADPKLLRAFVRHSTSVGDWLCDIATSTGNQALFSTAAGTENTVYFDDSASGSSIFGALTDYGTSHGAEYVFDTEVVRLEKDADGRVASVIAHDVNADAYVRYTASAGVILATGGYVGNREMIERYIPWVDYDALTMYSPIALGSDSSSNGNAGDGLKMALWAGARIGAVPHTPMIHFISGAMPIAGTCFVNARGERFADEGTSMEVMAQIVMRQPGHKMFQIADAKPSGMALMMQQAASAQADAQAAGGDSQAAGGDAAGGQTAGEEATVTDATAEGPASAMMMAGADGPTYDTLEELAEANGFDPDVLQATIDRWNELVAAGIDEDFGSDFSNAVSIDTPPYTCSEAGNCALAMMGGPQVNEKLEVLNESYEPIAGLYAIGNCVSGFYGPNYAMQVQSGIARAFTAVSGYLAAKNALGVAV